jgi:phage N-6-adenine-methyltransferase
MARPKRDQAPKGPAPTTRTLGRDDWQTPPGVFDPIHAAFGFALDASARDGQAARAPLFISPEEDALVLPWASKLDGVAPAARRVWLNPPYGRGVAAWVDRAAGQAAAGLAVVVLIMANTDTEYWARALRSPQLFGVVLLSGRVPFLLPAAEGAEAEPGGDGGPGAEVEPGDAGPSEAGPQKKDGAPKGSALLIFVPAARRAGLVPHAYWDWRAEPFGPVLAGLGAANAAQGAY